MEWPVLSNAIFGYHEYVGPYFLADDHCGFYDPNRHGMGAYTKRTPKEVTSTYVDKMGLRGKIVTELCLKAINQSNFVFAWLDAPSAYGTFCELGYAIAKEKPVYLASPPDFPFRKDLWFFETLSRGWITGVEPIQCLKSAIEHFFKSTPSRTQTALPSIPDIDLGSDPIAARWGFDQDQLLKTYRYVEPATDRQIRYINRLAAKQPEIAKEMEHIVCLVLGKEANFKDCNKSLAGYVIAALLGKTTPLE